MLPRKVQPAPKPFPFLLNVRTFLPAIVFVKKGCKPAVPWENRALFTLFFQDWTRVPLVVIVLKSAASSHSAAPDTGLLTDAAPVEAMSWLLVPAVSIARLLNVTTPLP